MNIPIQDQPSHIEPVIGWTLWNYLIKWTIITMSELSKFVNLLIEYEEKIEVNVNKKYKSFIRSVLNLEALAKTVRPDRIILSKELIVYKLGLEAKSPKAVEISLTYLLKLFQLKFIDVNQPNLCENYVIQEAGVKEVPVTEIKTEIRHQLIDLIKKNIHYKINEINHLTLKVLQFLISEPILPLLLDLAVQYPQEPANNVLNNYFSFRFYVFEEICYYNEAEIKSFSTLTLKNERIEKEIKNALQENESLVDLIGKYMNEYISIIEGEGGRYGNCVMCREPADHYCKVTRASLCGLECKKKHIEIAEKQYKHYFQFINLWEAIHYSFKELLVFLQTHESPVVFSVLANLLDKPHLFMLVKHKFRSLLAKHVPAILSKILVYKNESSFDHIYFFMGSLAKYWLCECLGPVQYFFKEYVLKVLEEKKPSIKFLNMIFRALAKIMQHGKVTIQLYINFDCEVNKQNVIEKCLFEVAKIAQDRFASGSHLSKQERQSVKTHCLTLFIILAMGLNQYRKTQHKTINVGQIIGLKQKKMSLQQFVIRFNEHWTSGLKTLFNLNLVGLDSNEEIVDILMNLRGLNKDNIDQLFFCEKGVELFQIFLKKLLYKNEKNTLMGLLQLHHYLPLKPTSIGVKKYIEAISHLQNESKEKEIMHWLQFLNKNYTIQDLKRELLKQKLYNPHEISQMHIYALETKQAFTVGNTKAYFTYCCSKSYLEVIASQISLLQIPISYLLETEYETDRILNLIQELLQICSHSNWISLLIKNSSINKFPTPEFDESKLKIVMGTIQLVEKQAYFIQDWSTIIHFLSHLENILRRIEAKQLVENKVFLSDELTVQKIEHCLISSASKSQAFFGKLMLAVLVVAREELEKQSLFMIHKFFEMLDANLKKFMHIIDDFIPHLVTFTKQLEKSLPQTCISIADMIKQSFAKLLKLQKIGDNWANNSQSQFWKLFQNLCNNRSREVSDFVVNCISMTILHHYDLSYKSWIVIFAFMKKRVKQYRQQVYTIIEKIIQEKMRNCEEFYSDLVELCLDLVHPTETKISIETLNVLRITLQLICQIKTTSVKFEDNEEEASKSQMAKLIERVIDSLVEFLYFQCHQYIIEVMFRLLKFKIHGEYAFSNESLKPIMRKIFNKVQSFTPETLFISQKTISFGLNWSVSHKYSDIILWLEDLIVSKYNVLSFSAVRCIKTYIQMLNPKTNEQWQHIQVSLLRILKDTRISDQLNLDIINRFKDYQGAIELHDCEIRTDVNLFSNKLMVQKSIIEILPNHLECLEELTQLHEEIIRFNDNLYLRCLLWRRGLGNNSLVPPNLLILEEIISSKLVSTFNISKETELFSFSLGIAKRYCQASAYLLQIISDETKSGAKQTKQAQNYSLYIDYLKLRKVPLLRVTNYFLPKFKKICKTKQQRTKCTLQLVECCKYVQNRDLFLKSIKELIALNS